MSNSLTRRSFVKQTVLSSASLALALPAAGNENRPAGTEAPSPAPDALPCGKIGPLAISRLILGGNLLTHYTHSRDLKYVYTLAAKYNTDEKIFETLALAERHGVNALTMHNPPHPMSLLRRYRKERGGRIQWIICPTAKIEPGLAEYRRHVEALLQDGCEAIYLWGVHADAMAHGGQMDLVAQAVELPKTLGVPSGVGAHDLNVIKACEQHGVPADFYIKTFHSHSYPTAPRPDELTKPYSEFPGYWCQNPQETAEFMKTVEKPWIAFKTMAAGAIAPKPAFRYSFLHGADFVLAGMFDFEIAEDVTTVKETLVGLENRARPWQA
jgi:hypothetical protein